MRLILGRGVGENGENSLSFRRTDFLDIHGVRYS